MFYGLDHQKLSCFFECEGIDLFDNSGSGNFLYSRELNEVALSLFLLEYENNVSINMRCLGENIFHCDFNNIEGFNITSESVSIRDNEKEVIRIFKRNSLLNVNFLFSGE